MRATTTAAAAATAVLRKFSMSLFRIPGPSNVALSRLSTSEPIVAPATTASSAPGGISPTWMRQGREEACAGDAGDGPLQGHRARGTRCHAPKGGHEVRASSPRLADFAGDRVAPAGRESSDEGEERRVACVSQHRQQPRDRGEAGIGDRVPGATASATLFGDPEERLAA